MKKKWLLAVLMSAVMMTGCGAAETTGDAKEGTVAVEEQAQTEEAEEPEAEDAVVDEAAESEEETTGDEATDSDESEESEVSADDYTDDVKKAVEEAALAGSLQEELSRIEEADASYAEKLQNAQTQAEMTQLSQWPALLWDTELNSLWSRAQETLESSELETLTAEQ